MSSWIRITHLPHYISCEAEVIAEFNKYGAIRDCIVLPPNPALRSTEAFIQFRQSKHAKLAACDKDSKIIGNNALNVCVVWCPKETLSTIEIRNLPRHIGNSSLQVEFEAWGEIVDSQISFDGSGVAIGRLSYTKVEYAIRAVEEMNGAILDKSDKPLKVKLANPDAKNLKWKRNAFKYIKIGIPKKLHNGNNHNRNHNNNNNKRRNRNDKRNHNKQHKQYQHQQQQQQRQQQNQGSFCGIGNNNNNNNNNSMGASSFANNFHQNINISRSNPNISTNSGVSVDSTNIQHQIQIQQYIFAQQQLEQQKQQLTQQLLLQAQAQAQQKQQQQQQHRLQQLMMQGQMDLLSIPTSSHCLSLTPTINALSSNGDVSPLRSLASTPTGASPSLRESKSLPMHTLNTGSNNSNSNNNSNNGNNSANNSSLNLNFNLNMNLMNATATLSNPSSLGSNAPSLSNVSQQQPRNMPDWKLDASTNGQVAGESSSSSSSSCLQSTNIGNTAIYCLSPEQSKLLENAKVNKIILPSSPTVQQSELSKPGLVLSTTSQAAPNDANFAKVQSTPPAPKVSTKQNELHSNPQWMWSPEQRKLGELLYSKIYPKYSKNAGKIVGVLLHKYRNNLNVLKNLMTKFEEQKQLESTINHCNQLLNSMGN